MNSRSEISAWESSAYRWKSKPSDWTQHEDEGVTGNRKDKRSGDGR